ncbi:MAG: hypothetical protein CBD27_09690 [Rhodospirillaceae bacterium TMED167]|nr:hypothetical protein [Rhodospirillaceae bacterium]OUW25244.1 MAG: hypothetical protein CBD27_09690 [Rhodospirillaceae bacterium TMED167]
MTEDINNFQLVRGFLAKSHCTNFHQRLLDLIQISVLGSVEKELSPEEFSKFAIIFRRTFSETSSKYIELATEPNACEANMINAIRHVEIDGYYLEFGVYKVGTINLMARLFPHQNFHGFDSFYGLHEKWGPYDV